jgi:hypothetical protein
LLLWEALVKTPSLPPPSATTTVDDTPIGAVGSIPPLPPSTTNAIAAIDNRHRRFHTVNNNDCQKPAVIVCR